MILPVWWKGKLELPKKSIKFEVFKIYWTNVYLAPSESLEEIIIKIERSKQKKLTDL